MDEVFISSSYAPKDGAKERCSNAVSLNSKIDYDLITSSIPKSVLSEKALNKKARELIDNLSFIYNFNTLQMIELLRSSLNEFGMIDKNELRINARKKYNLSSIVCQHLFIELNLNI